MYYQTADCYETIGKKKITSNCPGCGKSDCLELFLHQKRVETHFYTTTTKKVTGSLFCDHTHTEISSVLWTDEIKTYFKIEKSKLKLKPRKLKLTKAFYSFIAIPFLIIASAAGYSMYEDLKYADETEAISLINTGDKIKVLYTIIENNNVTNSGNTWFLVRKIDGDSIWVQRHEKLDLIADANFDLQDDNFNKETIKASLQQFKARGLFGHDYANQKFSGYITGIKN
ncbi:hypothetical protein H0I23_03310 [Cellulophaga sp. HaHaR_3_176]|uniref:hypothetical protein n=1 Tax=Cellulophaga sp. HaHaR_3_176 TaxID=1942464 RepID=UPI001C1FEB96|nr:hypothetical protein [Cellulophaga sp. HaHaR_3_176]QWX84688.1 hypothetical protein H0I23_03310 [Cellulophaga sp. HaHaR_3_176]